MANNGNSSVDERGGYAPFLASPPLHPAGNDFSRSGFGHRGLGECGLGSPLPDEKRILLLSMFSPDLSFKKQHFL